MKKSKFLLNKDQLINQKFSFEISAKSYSRYQLLQKNAELLGVKLVIANELARFFDKCMKQIEADLSALTENTGYDITTDLTSTKDEDKL
jgi:hypothetical protein